MKTIEDIKIGDKYYEYCGYGTKIITGIRGVVKITKTQVVLDNNARLRIVGDMSWCRPIGSGSFSITSYRLETEEIREELELQMLRTNAKELNDKVVSKIGSMSKDKLTYLIEFYKTLCIE